MRMQRLSTSMRSLCWTRKRKAAPRKKTYEDGLSARFSGRRAIVAMVDRIDAAHGPLASLFFDHVRDKSGCTRDHEYAVEGCGIHPQIGEDGANRAVYIDGKRFLRIGKCFLDCARRLHVHAVHAGFAREIEQTCSARIFSVQPMTKPRHPFTCFAHLSNRARRCVL